MGPAVEKPRGRGTEFKDISPEHLCFDPKNPRFGGAANRQTPDEIQHFLEGAPHLALQLVPSLIQNGFISYEPLVVRQEGKKYIVIEGNRRLAAVRHILANPSKYPSRAVNRLKLIPVLVFHEKADASHIKDIRVFLGVRHLVGFREWPPESKAMFLDQNIKSRIDVERITREFNIKKHDIRRYLIPYRVMKASREIFEEFEDIEEKEFWKLGESLTRSGIKEYVGLEIDPDSLVVRAFDQSKLRNLLEFLYGRVEERRPGAYRAVGTRRIADTRHLSRLGKVLSSKRAAEELEKGRTLEEAELYVETREETKKHLIDELGILLQNIILLRPSPEEAEKIFKVFQSFESAIHSFSQDAKSDV